MDAHDYANALDIAKHKYLDAQMDELSDQVRRQAKGLLDSLMHTAPTERESILAYQMVTLAKVYYDKGRADGFWKGIQ